MKLIFYWFFFLITTIFYAQAKVTQGKGDFGHIYVSKSIKRFHNESEIVDLIETMILPELEKYYCILNNKITNIQVKSKILYLELSNYPIGEIIHFKFSHLNANHNVIITVTELARYITHHTVKSPQPKFEKNLKVLSYNIFNYNDSWEKRVYLIADLISKLLPDIIGLQEVRLDESQFIYDDFHQITHIKELLIEQGYLNYLHQSAMLYSYPRSEEGLAIFSKYPVIDYSYILLGRDIDDPGSHQRICLYVLVETPIGLIQFFNTHLELKLEMSSQNAKEIIEFADKKLIENDSPQILVGDMNAEPSSETIQRFQANFKDSWIEFNPKGSGITFSTNRNYKKRIDFIFYRNFNKKVHDFRIVNKKKEVDASDHFGVQVEFK